MWPSGVDVVRLPAAFVKVGVVVVGTAAARDLERRRVDGENEVVQNGGEAAAEERRHPVDLQTQGDRHCSEVRVVTVLRRG